MVDGGSAYHEMTPSFFSSFSTATVNAKARGFAGAAFDGRYLYLVPSFNGSFDGLVARYDTTASFSDGASWSTFDTTTVNANAKGYTGAAFDGRYVYLVPYVSDLATRAPNGIVARYDTQASFTDGASWSTFDTTSVNANADGFWGAVFDGRYVYLVPLVSGSGADGIVARYDTQASFTDGASWSTFDTTTVNPSAKGFFGAAFDGRYIYLVPGLGSTVSRYDTQANFTASGSWTTFNTTTTSPDAREFAGGAFDGRYVYFVPHGTSSLTRYDTQANFGAGGSWSTFKTASGYPANDMGAAFDGRFVYMVPGVGGVMRFDAKTPPSMPKLPAWYGSFF